MPAWSFSATPLWRENRLAYVFQVLSNTEHIYTAFQVGGGVLSTASYEARKYGVRSGMAGESNPVNSDRFPSQYHVEFVARKLCPNLIVVKHSFQRYSEMSKRCMGIFRRYDPNMLAAGCDEGYLKCVLWRYFMSTNSSTQSITQYCADHQIDAETCVQEVRTAVQSETQLTVSAGIAPNKV